MSALREAMAGAEAPAATSDDLPRVLAAADNAAEDLALALSVAAKANDPDALPPIAVEAIVAAEGLAAAAKAAEAHYAGVRRAAKDMADAIRRALAAEMAAAGRKRVEASAHAATPEAGSLRVVIEDHDALPYAFTTTKVAPELSRIGKALAAGEAVPGARQERGPPSVRITPIRETAKQRA